MSNWNTTSYNFGPVKENSTLEYNFIYYNGTIKEVETSCGCTATMRTKNKINVQLKTGRVHVDKQKIKQVTLTVKTDDNLVHKLHLKAIVKKNE